MDQNVIQDSRNMHLQYQCQPAAIRSVLAPNLHLSFRVPLPRNSAFLCSSFARSEEAVDPRRPPSSRGEVSQVAPQTPVNAPQSAYLTRYIRRESVRQQISDAVADSDFPSLRREIRYQIPTDESAEAEQYHPASSRVQVHAELPARHPNCQLQYL